MSPNELTAYYGLPAEVKFCKRCTISNQRPSSVVETRSGLQQKKPTIAFDADGVCSACRYVEIKDRIDWKERERQLLELCDRHRSKDGSYDCVVPGSGGKDSVYTAHLLKYKYGMNPLTVTWAPHEYTDIGWKNFQAWLNSGFDNLLIHPNKKLHRSLTRLAFKNFCHPFQPFIIGQKLVGPRTSVQNKIPLVFFGESQAEYGNDLKENETPIMDNSFFCGSQRPADLMLGGVSAEALIKDHGVRPGDLNMYYPLQLEDLSRTGTQVHYLGYYVKWDPQEVFYYAAEHCGFKPNTERTEGSYSKYSSIDDKMDAFHYFTTFIKFGIGRATYDSAQEIRNRKITREEGVALVRKYDGEFPAKYFDDLLEYMEISADEFHAIIDKARSPHLWQNTGGQWRLRHQVS